MFENIQLRRKGNLVLKTLLLKRAKAQLDINGLVEGLFYITNLNAHLHAFVLLHICPIYKTQHMLVLYTKLTTCAFLIQNLPHTCPSYKTYCILAPLPKCTAYLSLILNLPHTYPSYNIYYIHFPFKKPAAFMSHIHNLPHTCSSYRMYRLRDPHTKPTTNTSLIQS